MSINVFSVLPDLVRAVGGILPGASGLANDLANAMQKSQLSAEQQQQLQAVMDAHAEKMRELDVQVETSDNAVAIATVQSTDKYVSRSTATLAYIAGGITAAMCGAILFGVKLDPTIVGTLLGALWAHTGTHAYFNRPNGNGSH